VKPLFDQFQHVPMPNNAWQYVKITYQANVRITSTRQATVSASIARSSDNNRTASAVAKQASALFTQLKGQIPPFPKGSNLAWLEHAQSYGINTPEVPLPSPNPAK